MALAPLLRGLFMLSGFGGGSGGGLPRSARLALTLDNREVLRNLNRAVLRIRNRSADGLLAAGKHVIGAATPHVPFSGDSRGEHLRDTGYAQTIPAGVHGPLVEVGYTAAYAARIHEFESEYPGARLTTSGTEWKFLENALRREAVAMLGIIATRSRV